MFLTEIGMKLSFHDNEIHLDYSVRDGYKARLVIQLNRLAASIYVFSDTEIHQKHFIIGEGSGELPLQTSIARPDLVLVPTTPYLPPIVEEACAVFKNSKYSISFPTPESMAFSGNECVFTDRKVSLYVESDRMDLVFWEDGMYHPFINLGVPRTGTLENTYSAIMEMIDTLEIPEGISVTPAYLHDDEFLKILLQYYTDRGSVTAKEFYKAYFNAVKRNGVTIYWKDGSPHIVYSPEICEIVSYKKGWDLIRKNGSVNHSPVYDFSHDAFYMDCWVEHGRRDTTFRHIYCYRDEDYLISATCRYYSEVVAIDLIRITGNTAEKIDRFCIRKSKIVDTDEFMLGLASLDTERVLRNVNDVDTCKLEMVTCKDTPIEEIMVLL
ncbi:MAG: hypothetical protein D6698_16905 [Gammaproteobacteria bacterium]|nr:MAG: hypothetical protein D6698_16905 [Gammaproteobacteria bacterium]